MFVPIRPPVLIDLHIHASLTISFQIQGNKVKSRFPGTFDNFQSGILTAYNTMKICFDRDMGHPKLFGEVLCAFFFPGWMNRRNRSHRDHAVAQHPLGHGQ